ncbi:MAG: arsenate reductase ArsC [Chloroflexi bacterium]|nr:arsenate reductase ArsC [Chloroflexota bacterium]
MRVLFVCTGNSARSQIAEALLRERDGEAFEAHSAGSEPSGLNPLTVRVLAEAGIDIGDAASTHVDVYVGEPWDYVITVCDRARESCPVFPHAGEQLHWSLEDPAAAEGDDATRMAAFRATRDDIRARIDAFVSAVTTG